MESYGATQCWVPTSTALVGRNKLAQLKTSQTIVKKMKDLFDGGKCCLSRNALSILGYYNLHNYGGSDEATVMIIAGAWKALFYDIGFDMPSHNLAKGCPSRRTISRFEHNIATDCSMKVLQDIKDDGATKIGIVTDHGHRGGQDHFVILLCWSGRKKNGARTLKFFCPSIDRCGHTAQQAAEGVKKVTQRFLGSNTEIEVKFYLRR